MIGPADILIATVHDDGAREYSTVTRGYMKARERMIHAGCLPMHSICASEDIVRARSRLVTIAIASDVPWKYMLWWDDDVVPDDVSILSRMHRTMVTHDLDMLGAPYPRKRIPIDIPYKPLRYGERYEVRFEYDGAAEVEGVGIGFCLMSRRCLDAMTRHYRDELWATDDAPDANGREMVCIFDLAFTDVDEHGRRFKLSEDYSIQARWRAMGGKVYMYAEPGMKLGHAGRFMYEGTFADLGNPK